jgi:hypothetical protein
MGTTMPDLDKELASALANLSDADLTTATRTFTNVRDRLVASDCPAPAHLHAVIVAHLLREGSRLRGELKQLEELYRDGEPDTSWGPPDVH